MEFFFDTELVVPISQIVLLLFISTLSLLFGKVKIALMINYFFTLYWAYFFNRDRFLELGLMTSDTYAWIYFGFGLMVALLAVIGFLTHAE